MLTIRGAKWYENIKRLGTPVLKPFLMTLSENKESQRYAETFAAILSKFVDRIHKIQHKVYFNEGYKL